MSEHTKLAQVVAGDWKWPITLDGIGRGVLNVSFNAVDGRIEGQGKEELGTALSDLKLDSTLKGSFDDSSEGSVLKMTETRGPRGRRDVFRYTLRLEDNGHALVGECHNIRVRDQRYPVRLERVAPTA